MIYWGDFLNNLAHIHKNHLSPKIQTDFFWLLFKLGIFEPAFFKRPGSRESLTPLASFSPERRHKEDREHKDKNKYSPCNYRAEMNHRITEKDQMHDVYLNSNPQYRVSRN